MPNVEGLHSALTGGPKEHGFMNALKGIKEAMNIKKPPMLKPPQLEGQMEGENNGIR